MSCFRLELAPEALCTRLGRAPSAILSSSCQEVETLGSAELPMLVRCRKSRRITDFGEEVHEAPELPAEVF